MKNALHKSAFREIRSTLSRFLSIFGIVALGVGFFAGVKAAAPDMRKTSDGYYDEKNLTDFRIVSTYGFDENDIAALEKTPGALVYPSYYTDVIVTCDGRPPAASRIYSLSDFLLTEANMITLVQGRMPENEHECLVNSSKMKGGPALGSKISITDNSGELPTDMLNVFEYDIVGVCVSPVYIDKTSRGSTSVGNGSIESVYYVPEKNFCVEYNTEVYLKFPELDGYNCYEDGYKDRIDVLSDVLEDTADTRSEERYNDIMRDADEEIADAEQKLSDAQKEADEKIADGEKELSDAREKLDDAKKQLEDGEQEITENEQKLIDGEKEIAENEQKLIDAENEIADNEQKLIDAKKEIEENRVKLEDAQKEIDENEQKLIDGEKEIAENEQKLIDAQKEIEESEQKLSDGERELAENEQKLIDGERELARGEEELEKNEKQFREAVAEAEQKLSDGEKEYNDGLSQYNDGLKQYEDGLSEYNAAVSEFNEKKAQYEAGYAEFTQNEAALSQAKGQLDEAQAGLNALKAAYGEDNPAYIAAYQEYSAGLARYEAGMAALEEARPAMEAAGVQIEEGQAQLDAAGAQLAATKVLLDENKEKLEAAEKELSDGRKELEDQKAAALEEFANAREKIEESRQELISGREQLEKGRQELADGRKELEEGKIKLEDGKRELEEGKRKLADGRRELEEGKQELADGWIKLEEAEQEVADAEKKLEDGKRELADGRKELEDGRQELADGRQKLEDAKKELEDGRREYEDGLKELKDGEKELEDGKAEANEKITDARKELDDAKEELSDLEKPKWYIFTRSDNPGYAEYGENSERINNIASVFPVFFIVVAMLVCLTTMSRMIEEQRVQIGTFKALGYSEADIMFKYMFYALSATVAGSVVGCAVGMKLFPYVIITAYGMMYELAQPVLDIDFSTALISTGVFSLAIALTVFLTARSALLEQSAQLMRPKAPKNGKRILLERVTLIWKHFNFSGKVTARNLFRYKRKMLMTVIGISGCTALLVTGFALYDSINDIIAKQFNELQHYQGMLVYDEKGFPGSGEKAAQIVSRHGDSVKVYQKLVTVNAGGRNVDAYIAVPSDPELFGEYFTLRKRTTGKGLALNDGDIYLDEKTTLLLGGIKAGDSITLSLSDTQKRQVTLTSDFENYPNHYVYMTPATYTSVFGEEPEFNALYFRHDLEVSQQDDYAKEILETDGVLSISFNSDVMDSFSSLLDPLNYVIGVIIGSAGLLAFVVMYNLTNINITERIREIATLKVLGFYDGEVDSYIFRENILLSLLGTAVGLILGIFLARFIITTAEVDLVMFGRNIYAPSFIWAALMTMLFSALVTVAMHGRLKNINMIEALKSVE